MKNIFSLRVAALACALCIPNGVPALAEPTRDAVMAGAERCEGIPDNRVWLDCFYGSAQPMRAVLGLRPAPESQTRLVPGPGTAYGGAAAPLRASARQPSREKSGGFWSDLVGNTKPLAANMAMTAYGFGRDGKFTVTMADGHVWQQAESDIRSANWTGPAQSYKATINYGTAPEFFNMRVNGVVYKVTRVK